MEQNKEEETKPNNKNKKKLGMIVLAALVVIGAVTVFFYLRYKAAHVSTDDAYVDGYIHTIASKISGTVKNIYIKDNQAVKKGDLLLEIDPIDYKVKVDEASSSVDTERAKLSEIDARIEVSKDQLSELTAALEAARANYELQEANLKQAERDGLRAENLYRSETISKDRYEKTLTAASVAQAQAKAAREQVKRAEKALGTQKSVIRQVMALKGSQVSTIKEKAAKLDAAELNYGYTKVYAPVDGYISKRSVETGNQIQAGQPLMAVVPLDDIYVAANYKETQLQKIKPGQRVDIKVDTYPGKTFKGKVDSIMAGTGSVFSLFPPENATGNYVKVVQRVPVKIIFERDTDPEHVLRIGMSVVPTVIVE
ncbi:MAG TPA: HlyD family secretion protein [Thermodesulfovibrionales bacterium]|nr:HlyD family secretion protein [Thermodesulfovibrionales bacterium]